MIQKKNWIVYIEGEDSMPFFDVLAAEKFANGCAEMGKVCLIFQKVFTIQKKITREVTMPTERNFQVFLDNEKLLKSTKR